jgi:putative transposase
MGRRFKGVTMTDFCSKEVPVSEADNSHWRGARLPHSGSALCRRVIAGDRVLDNGPEFLGTALDAWAAQYGVTLHVIQPGKQVRNAFIGASTGKFRDECLNEHWFLTSQEAQVVVEAWRRESNASELTVRSGM